MYYKTISIHNIYIYVEITYSSSCGHHLISPKFPLPPWNPLQLIHLSKISRSPWHGPAAVISGFRPGNGNRPWTSRNFVGRCYQGPWCTSHFCRKHTGAGTCTHLRTKLIDGLWCLSSPIGLKCIFESDKKLMNTESNPTDPTDIQKEVICMSLFSCERPCFCLKHLLCTRTSFTATA